MTAAIIVAASLPFAALLLGRPLVRRLAVRSMLRRPMELFLVVVGSMLATAILTGSLLVGDTVDRSIRAVAYDQLGPVDELVETIGLEQGAALQRALADFRHDDVDGILPMTTAGAAAVGLGRDPLVQPTARLVEVDFAAAAAFGGDRHATGITGPTPDDGRAAITRDLAAKVEIGIGDRLQVFAYGTSVELAVDRILPRTGLAGFWTQQGQRSYNVFVAPGTIARLAAAAPPEAEQPSVLVAVSNVGDVEGGAERTASVTAALEEAAGGLGGVRTIKQDVLDIADSLGASLGDLYFTVGMFAVAAGILLLVNIFVMLADERRQELGMMRAVGLRRAPMVGQFAAEGWLYAFASAAVGSLVGIGVGWVIAWRSGQILSSGREVETLQITFAVDPGSVVGGFALGFLLSLLTIVLTSTRIARLNVISAIRDLPSVRRQRPRRRWSVLGGAAFAAGTAWTVVSVVRPDAYGIIAGPALAAVGSGPAAARRWPARQVLTVVATGCLVWGLGAVPVLGRLGAAIDIPVFLLQGLLVVAAAVAVVTVHQRTIGRALRRLSRGALAVRVGLAYPLAHPFRTAMTLGMVAIVVLTLTYISVISTMFDGQADDMTADQSGGFEVIVQSNPSNPVPGDQLAGAAGVDAVAPLAYAAMEVVIGEDDPVRWPLSGFGPELLAAPPALSELGDHPDDAAAWRAVLDDPGLIIVDEYFLVTDAGPPSHTVEVGDTIVVTDPLSGRQREVTVAALTGYDWLANGAFYGIDGMRSLYDAAPTRSRAFVSTSSPEQVADSLRRTFVANGIEADTIRSRVDNALALNSAFFTLMEQFVGVGLVVGMAGIGVVMIRAVRERRREIGVLRSLGFPTRQVSRSFVVEAGFVAVEAVVLGVSTALVASYGLVESGADWSKDMNWAVPWGELALIVGLTLAASLLASLWPARSAARIRPAVALRLAD